VIEAVAFSMLVERVAWNFKECSAAGKSQTAACARHDTGCLSGGECVASSSATRL
jgi:hypothetical protein